MNEYVDGGRAVHTEKLCSSPEFHDSNFRVSARNLGRETTLLIILVILKTRNENPDKTDWMYFPP